jgi:hypothetical protein
MSAKPGDDPPTYGFFARGVEGQETVYKGSTGAGASGTRLLEGSWASDTVQVFVDGQPASAVVGANWAPDNHSLLRLGISSGNATSHPFSGDIAEILIYNRELTTPERNQVGEYLEAKYGLTTSYVTNNPTGVRLSHSGNAQPDTGGWSYGYRSNAWDNGPNCSSGAVTDDGGYDAWNINDGSTAVDTVNHLVGGLTAEEREAAATDGWILRARRSSGHRT